MFYKLKDIKYKIKWAIQRVVKGYDNRATWDYFDWFSDVSSKIFKEMSDNHCGYPAGMTDEEWANILNKISFLLNESSEERCLMKNEYEDEYFKQLLEHNSMCGNKFVPLDTEVSKKYYDKEDEIFTYRDKCKDEALDLIKKYYWNLWD